MTSLFLSFIHYFQSFKYVYFHVLLKIQMVATKRAALLLDRLMVALQKAVDDQGVGSSKNGRTTIEKDPLLKSSGLLRSIPRKPVMDLQRRGHSNGGVYWRCYFNAVTCFKKK